MGHRGLRGRWKGLRAATRARWRAWRVAAANRERAGTCFYCGVALTPPDPRPGARPRHDQRTVDHRVPRARGGSDALSNLVFACFACNQRKRDRDEDAFVASGWLAARRTEVAGRDGAGPEGPAPD